ncbi:MAG: ADP-ribosylglycohydrolase family protein [Bdellovibrionales bacterium]|nr:ADP-ribosylglycohydrolase family protein [Bdellovibrionales bacterium]
MHSFERRTHEQKNEDPEQDMTIDLFDRTQAMSWGVAIGDALGLPFETKQFGEIDEDFEGDKTYRPIRNHVFISDCPPGTTSDDQQLTRATMQALISDSGLTLEGQAKALVAAYKETTFGWGGTTKTAVRRLLAGESPTTSGRVIEEGKGAGNGVNMRLSPVAAMIVAEGRAVGDYLDALAGFAGITHQSSAVAQCTLAHVAVLCELLKTEPKNFDPDRIVDLLVSHAELGEQFFPEQPSPFDLKERFESLRDASNLTDQEIVDRYGGGACPVFHSIPFSFAFFLREPHSYRAVYDAINSGGDTDSNASIVGGLLGALNGMEIVPPEYIEQLPTAHEISTTQRQFEELLRKVGAR